MPDYTSQLNHIINTLNQLLPSPSQQSLNLISAIAATLAAFAGFWAAYAASKSARTSQEAADNVQQIARLAILRDITTAAYEVVAEYEQVKSLAEEVKMQIKALATHAGHGRNSSVVKEITEKAESRENEIMPLQHEAHDLIQKRSTLTHSCEVDLMRELSKFDGYLARIIHG